MSIVSGEGSPHPKAQERIDFSTENLKVGSWREGNYSVGHQLQRGWLASEAICSEGFVSAIYICLQRVRLRGGLAHGFSGAH